MCTILNLTQTIIEVNILIPSPLYLCELIEQQNTANTRLASDVYLLKLPPPSRNCADPFFSVPFFMRHHTDGTSSMDVSDGLPTLINMFKSEIKTVLFFRYFDN